MWRAAHAASLSLQKKGCWRDLAKITQTFIIPERKNGNCIIVCVYIYIHTHTHTHTYIYIHTHLQFLIPDFMFFYQNLV